METKRMEGAMLFLVYVVLFLGGFYLFGAAFNAEAWQGLIFSAGIFAVSLALGLVVHSQRKS